MSLRPSKGISATIPPPIPTAYKWATEYKPTDERPLLDMSQGVPRNPPEELLQDAITEATKQGAWGYCPAEGELVLREALVEEIKLAYAPEVDLTAEDVAITVGCNMAFVAAAMALADNGDEIILPLPWYFNHQMTLTMLGIKPVPLKARAEDGFLPSPEKCKALITPRTKAIALVSPNNPTGAIYPPSLLAEFSAIARDAKIALIIDETYHDFITTGAPHHLFSASSDWRSHLVHLYSFSKSYRIPGHRVGALIAAPSFITHVNTVLDCLQICAPRVPQLALAPLLPALRPSIRDMAVQLQHRHVFFREFLPERWTVGTPEETAGGYYAFVRHPFKGKTSEEVAKRLATESGVICLPGDFFCEKDVDIQKWLRFSVANVDEEKVLAVCKRLEEAETAFGWELDV
ncbi:PLP-dependent transferase [Cylindrobasidium torrendii FP15055 ss-10]|uniref:PLP-dependent transferase n=1 Tax=Cylindrobasidium torrendii FP15055 ss-10 TaxID=1314674 RepID=A0A0D7BKU9_9AGAR|nr:PLP-dependent transferase [Cylindrobasidium torrendii FP15055 ss-10]